MLMGQMEKGRRGIPKAKGRHRGSECCRPMAERRCRGANVRKEVSGPVPFVLGARTTGCG